jgi:GTP diphosphokinase / guanosine-3',5'-bis(diphosphate) 3'-diphosphatase
MNSHLQDIKPYALDEEQEKKLILREYRSLLTLLKPRLTKSNKRLLRNAFEIAAEAHQHTRRKSGEPYILHPIAVAKIVVSEIGLGVRSSIAALLHDTVEDTDVTLDEIEKEFGNEISVIIDGLTKIGTVKEANNNASHQAENFRKVLLTMVYDPRVVLIKIADRMHNMRTMQSMKREKQLKISAETSYIYAPLAHRLGLYEISSELQDLSLRYTEPDVYEEIVQKLADTQRERDKFIRDFIRPIREILLVEGFDVDVFGRSKSISSIYNKIKNKGVTFEEVYDLFAIRIIVNSPAETEKADCWRIYAILGNLYRTGHGRLRDWLTEAKGNGYQALHNTFIAPSGKFVEVQVRSQRMNEIAEKGIAAHWKYKEGIDETAVAKKPKDGKQNTEHVLERFLGHIKDLLKNLDNDSVTGIQDIKKELFTDEMYVYTPKGDMRVLAVGSTALDFAFDIHSELGRRCIGAKVNYKLVPISYVLKNGDQIEIITSSKQKPNEDWLKFVATGKALSRIRYYLKEEKRVIAEDGRYAVEKKLRSLNIPHTTAIAQELATHFKLSSPLDLYYAIATDTIQIDSFKKIKYVHDKLDFGEDKKASSVKDISKDVELGKQLPGKGYELILFGESSNQIKYKLASCCNPISGDDVFGFVTSSEGLKIHRTSCPNAPGLMANYGHRIVKAKWAGSKSLSFLTVVKIIGLDDVGVIAKITNVISGDLKINMRSMSIESNNGIFEGTVAVFVHNKEELAMLCERLEGLEGIQRVNRLEIEED